MPSASTKKVKELAGRLKRSERTVWRWIQEGLDVTSERSVRAFSEGKELRKTNVQKARERREAFGVSDGSGSRTSDEPELGQWFSGELSAPRERGAAAALERLEESEERSHARLLIAMETGNRFQIEALQDFWLKCSETLRKLDIAVDLARRDRGEQVPKRLVEEISFQISAWLCTAFGQFLSAEAQTLIGIRGLGESKAYAIRRFHEILEVTVKSSMQTIPDWAAAKVREAWNIG
jgi:hypothetical protein